MLKLDEKTLPVRKLSQFGVKTTNLATQLTVKVQKIYCFYFHFCFIRRTKSVKKGCICPLNMRRVPTDSPPYVSLLALYVVLGVLVGSVVVCWCCWSPGWFLWRVSVCRFLPCCNSCCASCQLCGRSCLQNKEHRLAKVTPQQASTPAATAATTTTTTVAV